MNDIFPIDLIQDFESPVSERDQTLNDSFPLDLNQSFDSVPASWPDQFWGGLVSIHMRQQFSLNGIGIVMGSAFVSVKSEAVKRGSVSVLAGSSISALNEIIHEESLMAAIAIVAVANSTKILRSSISIMGMTTLAVLGEIISHLFIQEEIELYAGGNCEAVMKGSIYLYFGFPNVSVNANVISASQQLSSRPVNAIAGSGENTIYKTYWPDSVLTDLDKRKKEIELVGLG